MSRAQRIADVSSMSHHLTRRRALAALLVATLIARHPPQDVRAAGKEDGSSSISGETFVGRTSDPDVFVAVVLGAQHETAYLCDGSQNQIALWFQGEVHSNPIDVTAANGARLVGTRSGLGISGGASLHDGRGISFLAEPAAGFGGLYAVRVHADGRIHGDANTQSVLDGTLIRSRSAQQPVEAGARFAAQITQPDGHELPIEVRTASADPGQYWVIVLADGAARGDGIAIISSMGLRAS